MNAKSTKLTFFDQFSTMCHTNEIEKIFAKAMRCIPAAYPDREQMEITREIFSFCQPLDPYTRPLLTSSLATFMSATGIDLAWNPYMMETDHIQRSKISVVEILRSNYPVVKSGVEIRFQKSMNTVSSYLILVYHYLNHYEQTTTKKFNDLYNGDSSLETQLERDDSVDRYS